MLYDPTWEQKTKARPFSFASFVHWLEAKHPEDRYYTHPVVGCLLGQFAQAMGASDPEKESYALGRKRKFSAVAFDTPCTFGAALERARSL